MLSPSRPIRSIPGSGWACRLDGWLCTWRGGSDPGPGQQPSRGGTVPKLSHGAGRIDKPYGGHDRGTRTHRSSGVTTRKVCPFAEDDSEDEFRPFRFKTPLPIQNNFYHYLILNEGTSLHRWICLLTDVPNIPQSIFAPPRQINWSALIRSQTDDRSQMSD